MRLPTVLCALLVCASQAMAIEVEPTAKEHTLVRVKLAQGEAVQVLAVQIVQVNGVPVGRLRAVEAIATDSEVAFTGPPGYYTLLVSQDGRPTQPREVQIVGSSPNPPTPPTPVPPGPEPGPTPGPDVPDELGATGARLYPVIKTIDDKPSMIKLAANYRAVLNELNSGSIISVQVARTRLANANAGMSLASGWRPAITAMSAELTSAGGDIEALKKVFRGTIAALELAAK